MIIHKETYYNSFNACYISVKNPFIFEVVIVFPFANHHALLASNKNVSRSDLSILFLGLSNLVINSFSTSINLLPLFNK